MNSRNWLRVSGFIVAALSFAVSGSATLLAEQSPSVTGKAPFVAAPALPLAYAPASMAVGDLNGDGKLDLVTADWNSGRITVSLGLGNGSFAAGVDYAAGSHPTSLILADVDGDGRLDLVAANAASGTVSVLLGNGTGQFQQPRAYKLGFNSSLLVAGDFGGKGRVDLVAVDASSNRFALLQNDEQGGFGAPILHALNKTPAAVTVADLKREGGADLAFANTDGTVSILWGDKGSFQAGPSVAVAARSLSAILAGDFNHDGILDLAVAIPGTKEVAILAGKGSGNFSSPATYRVGGNPVAILSADVDEDGLPDLVVTNQGSNTFSVLTGKSDGSFAPSLDYVAGKGPIAATAGDFDNDGHLDLAVLNRDGQSLSLPLGNGDGTFRAARAYNVEFQPRSVAAGDLVGNKRSDLVVTNFCGSDLACAKAGSVSVLVAGENGSYRLASNYPLGAGPIGVALLDVDGDGILDIVALNRTDKTVSILLGLGAGSFQQQSTLPLTQAPVGFAVGDFNRDGKADLAVIGDCGSAKCAQAGALEILYGGGDGSFHAGPSYSVDFAPASVAVADLNGDKNLDIVVANRCGKIAACNGVGTASVFLGAAAGRFSAGQTLSLGKSPSAIALADLGRRGTPDLLVSRSSDNTLAILRGNGDGTFGAAVAYSVGNTPGSIAVADFNGDGKLDIAVGNVVDSTVSLLYGKGDGTLAAGPATSVGPGPSALATLQIGSGSHAGLVTANANSDSSLPGSDVTVLANLRPELTNPVSIQISANPTSANVNDLVTLTAVVTGDAGHGAPTGGTVTFNSTPDAIADCNGTSSNIVSTSSAGGADATKFVCVTHSLQATSQTVNATYNGDLVYGTLTTATAATVAVTAIPATLTLNPPATAQVNSSATFTATFSATPDTPTAPSGKIHFLVNGATSADCPDIAVTSPPFTCTTKALTVGNGAVAVGYIDDTNFSATDVSKTVTVTPAPATLTLTPPAASVPVNSSATFTATFSATTTPTPAAGKVHFLVNGATSADCPDIAVATPPFACTTKTLTVGNGTVAVSYISDDNFTATAVSKAATVTKIPATLTLTPSVTTALVNTPITFTPTVTPSITGPTVPSGETISFLINGSASGDCANVAYPATPQTGCTTSRLTVNAHQVTASSSGDPNFTVTPATAPALTINPITGSLQVTVSPTNPAVNGNVKITVTPLQNGTTQAAVSPTAPINTVAFTVNGAAPGATGPLNQCRALTFSGTTPDPNCNTAFPQAQSYGIVASYPTSDPNFVFTQGSASVNVGKASGLTVTQSVSPSGTAQYVFRPVTFTVTVTPPTGGLAPTGTITFTQTQTLSGSNPTSTTPCISVALTNGQASCTVTYPNAASIQMNAAYAGNDYGNTSANQEVIAVQADPTTVTITPTAASAINQKVTFTATVMPTYPSATSPAGTVVFTDTTTGKTMCTPPVTVTAGTASCAYTFPSGGTQTITAAFTPTDKTQFAANSGTLQQTVNASNVSLSLTPPAQAPIVNLQTSLVVVITPSSTAPSGTLPDGTVSITEGSTTLCPSLAITAGVVKPCPYTFTTAGVQNLTITYTPGNSGDFNTATLPAQVTVAADPTSAAVTFLPASVEVNQTVTLTATITPTNIGSATMTGTVTFTDTPPNGISTNLCTGAAITVVNSGSNIAKATATCPTTFSQSGSHSLTATFSPVTASGGNYSTSLSPTVTSMVNADETTPELAITAPTTTPAVNTPVTFSTTITPKYSVSGNTPTGTVTFVETASNATLCTIPVTGNAAGGASASCTTSALTAGTHAVTSTYSNTDGNFLGKSSNSINETVVQEATSVAITLVAPNPIATQKVTLTAVVSPTTVGPILPKGYVQFTSNDPTASAAMSVCSQVPVTAAQNGTSVATCAVAFDSQDYSPATVSASYIPDTNFLKSGPTSTSQPVMNFALQASASTPILVTPGYSSTKDPFLGALPAVTLTSAPTDGFSDALAVTCAISLVSTPSTSTASASLPTCTLVSSSNSMTLSGKGSDNMAIQISAGGTVPVGQYLATLTATDTNTNTTLTHSTTVPINVLDVAGTLNLQPGASGTVPVVFVTSGAQNITLTNPTCTKVLSGGVLLNTTGITCKAPATVSVTGPFTTVPIVITAGSSTSNPSARGGSAVQGASLWIGPLLLAGFLWLTGRRTRRGFLRFLSLILLAAGIGNAIGCGGGSFTPPTNNNQGTAPGSYFVQAVYTGSDGVEYTAVIPVFVN